MFFESNMDALTVLCFWDTACDMTTVTRLYSEILEIFHISSALNFFWTRPIRVYNDFFDVNISADITRSL